MNNRLNNTTAIDPEIAKMLGIEVAEPPLQVVEPSDDPLAFLNKLSNDAPKKKAGKNYPVLPDPDGAAGKLARRIIELAEFKSELETNNKLLGEMATPHWFTNASGKPETESSVKVLGGKEGNVLVTFQQRVKKMESAAALKPVAHLFKGKEKDLFFHSFDLKIDSDEIPAVNQPAFVKELTELLAKHGASKALGVERQYKPLPAFWSQRHLLFSREANLEINRTMPVIVAVKTKGVT